MNISTPMDLDEARSCHAAQTATDADLAVSLDAVSFSYDRGASWAVQQVSMRVRRAERLCIIGPNGSGKSTLARIIAGLVAPDVGLVTLLDHRVFAHGRPDADAYRSARRTIGAVFQNPEDQIVTTVVAEDVAFGPENLGVQPQAITRRVDSALNVVDMLHTWSQNPTTMSGGQQQRIAIAGTLAMRPSLIVLDEPTAMLDPDARHDVMALLDRLQQEGTTIIHITHRAEETLHADRVIVMDHGQITSDGIGDGVAASPQQTGISIPDQLASHRAPFLEGKPAIDVRDVTMIYPDNGQHVLTDFSLQVMPGETVAIMGANGTGKSTLARLLCALRTPNSGSISVAGISLSAMSRRSRKLLRRRVGYVMQHPERQLFASSVAQDIAYGPRNQGLTEDHVGELVTSTMRLLHIEDLAERSPFALSGGQQRLVAIAGVLACNPQVLVVDEPTANLDSVSTARIHAMLSELQQRGVTIVLITHSQAEADALADRTIVLDSGTDGSADCTAAVDEHDSKPRSILASLDPRMLLGCFTVLMCSSFAVLKLGQLATMLIMVCAVVVAARVHPRQLFQSIRMMLVLFLVTGVLNLFVVHTGTAVITLGGFTITDDALSIAILYSCRLAVVIVLGAVLLFITTPTALTDALASLLAPLQAFGVHTREFALVLSLALRFLPTLGRETRGIVDAQAARGGSIESGSVPQRIRALAAIIVPIFAGTLRHAENLSLALDARCYEQGVSRTRWHELHLRARDLVFGVLTAAYIAALIIVAIL